MNEWELVDGLKEFIVYFCTVRNNMVATVAGKWVVVNMYVSSAWDWCYRYRCRTL